MPQFRYRAVTLAGEIVVGEVDAPSREEVVRRIEYLGHLTIDAEIATTGILSRGRGRLGKLPRSRDVSIFLRQLALLMGAGLTLEAALQTLGDDASKGLAGFANGYPTRSRSGNFQRRQSGASDRPAITYRPCTLPSGLPSPCRPIRGVTFMFTALPPSAVRTRSYRWDRMARRAGRARRPTSAMKSPMRSDHDSFARGGCDPRSRRGILSALCRPALLGDHIPLDQRCRLKSPKR
jgi:hypothetical protein